MDESVFVKLLGSSPVIKVLDFLLTSREFDYPKRDIADNASISYNTLNSILPSLIAEGIVVKTRRVGKQDLFMLNQENAAVAQLLKFFDSLLMRELETHAMVARKIPAS